MNYLSYSFDIANISEGILLCIIKILITKLLITKLLIYMFFPD